MEDSIKTKVYLKKYVKMKGTGVQAGGCALVVEGIFPKKGPYLIFSTARFRPVPRQAPQKPQCSPCLPLVLFEGFLGSVRAQDAGHLQ